MASFLEYNIRCVPKTAGENSLINPAEGGKLDLLSVPVSLRTGTVPFFERTDNFPGGEH